MKIVQLFFLLITAIQINGQVSVTGCNVNPYRLSYVDFMNVTAVNMMSANLNGVFRIELKGGNAMLMTIITKPIELLPGNNVIKGASIIDEVVFSEIAEAIYLRTQMKLLGGNYEVCYEFNSHLLEFPSTTCLPILSAYSSFLFLVSPVNREVINTAYPNLVWTTNNSLPLVSTDESYECHISEIQNGQTALEALYNSSQVCVIRDLKLFSFVYPTNCKSLLPGREYAWEVVHLFKNEIIERTEIWTFRLDDLEDPRDLKYVDISASDKIGIVKVYNSFYFRFDEKYQTKNLNLVLKDSKGEIVFQQNQNSENSMFKIKQSGFNGYRFNLKSLGLKSGLYRLEVLDGANRSYIIQIDYSNE